jgi:ribosome-binding factor A
MTDRMKRVNQLIKEKIADILLREVNFDKDILVTVQSVDTSRDLKYAKVGVSVMPSGKSEEILKILEKRTSYIQRELNKAIEIKFVPKIKFEIDKGEEKTSRVEEILKEI